VPTTYSGFLHEPILVEMAKLVDIATPITAQREVPAVLQYSQV